MARAKMGKADGLSRRSDWKVGVDKDNENQVFIKDNWIRSMYEVVVEVLSSQIVDLVFLLSSIFIFILILVYFLIFLFLE